MGIRRFKISPGLRLQLNKYSEVYIDSSFILRCFIDESCLEPNQRSSFRLAKALLQNVIQQKAKMLMSTLAFDEVWYIYLKLLYQRDNGKNTWNGRILKDHPETITKYKTELEELQKKIKQNPHLRVIGISKETVDSAFLNMLDHRLAPRDSFHFSICCHEQAECFVSGDRDFSSIPSDSTEIDIKLIEF